MTTTRDTRPGVSLLEVLVAIFVVAIGLLALLTLFPLGAMRMGQALKDARTSETALLGDGVLRAYWRHNVISLPLHPSPNPKRDVPLYQAFSDPSYLNPPLPNSPWGPPNQRAFLPPAGANRALYAPQTAGQPSYPVLIDPLGLFARGPTDPEQFWVAHKTAVQNPPFTLIPRRNLSMAINAVGNSYQQTAILNCCLTDDFGFQANGVATDPNGQGLLTRQGRYSWAAMLQMPPKATDRATLDILVFDGRPPLLATPGDEVVTVPLTPGGKLTPGDRAVTLSVPNRGTDQTPLVRKGGWIMDGTIDNLTGPIRHANFYRIVGVTDGGPDPSNANNTLFTLDLETPIKRDDGRPLAFPESQNVTARIYLFAGLAEVFERPPLVPDP